MKRNDPFTSIEAKKSVTKITQTQSRIFDFVTACGGKGGLTDEGIEEFYWHMMRKAKYPAVSPSGLRTRRAELVKKGKLVGRYTGATTNSGRKCLTWFVVKS